MKELYKTIELHEAEIKLLISLNYVKMPIKKFIEHVKKDNVINEQDEKLHL